MLLGNKLKDRNKTDLNPITVQSESIKFEIRDEPVMELVLDAISILGKNKEITILAKGKFIATAVTVALIITEKMMNKNSKIVKIKVDSEPIFEMGGIQSTIEIVLRKF